MKAPRNEPRRAGRPRNPVPREVLLQHAIEAFAELSYTGASMNEIAERAGIRKASLFHHFASKEALYLEALAQVVTKLGRMIESAHLDRDSFAERLDRLSSLVTEYLGGTQSAARLLMRELVGRGPYLNGPGAGPAAATLALVTAFFQSGIDSGECAPCDASHLATTLLGLHLCHFASPVFSGQVIGRGVFEPLSLEERRKAVILQTRRLCGLPDSSPG